MSQILYKKYHRVIGDWNLNEMQNFLKLFALFFAYKYQSQQKEISQCSFNSCHIQDHLNQYFFSSLQDLASRKMNFFRVGARNLHFLTKTKTKEEIGEYMKVFPRIVRDLTESDEFADIPQFNKWFARVLDYNVPHGNKGKTLTMLLSYKSLEEPDKFTPDNQKLSNILGWCFEINQIALLMQDDMLDAAVTRRKRPCWYKLEDVGITLAVNDVLLLENSVYEILKKYFSEDPSYAKYMECFFEATYRIGIAQVLDAVTIKEGKSNINAYTMSRYKKTVKYQSESYSFILPVLLAMHLAKKFDPVDFELVRPILEQLGRLAQVNNDFIDVYGDPTSTGHAGEDIKNGTCSWIICAAVERASENQKRVLQANYGRDHPGATQAVKHVYDKLDMKGAYEEYETQKLKSLRDRIEQIYERYPHKRFLEFLNNYATQSNWKDTEAYVS